MFFLIIFFFPNIQARYKLETQENQIEMLTRDNNSLRALEKNITSFWQQAGTSVHLENVNEPSHPFTEKNAPYIPPLKRPDTAVAGAFLRNSTADLLRHRHSINHNNNYELAEVQDNNMNEQERHWPDVGRRANPPSSIMED